MFSVREWHGTRGMSLSEDAWLGAGLFYVCATLSDTSVTFILQSLPSLISIENIPDKCDVFPTPFRYRSTASHRHH